MPKLPDISVREVFADCDHSGLFPSPGGAKVVVSGGQLFFTYGLTGGGSIVRGFDGTRWSASPRLGIGPPYIAVDTRGFIHVAGLHSERRDSIFYFRSREPNSIEAFSDGEVIHPKNYTSMAVDERDDSLFYVGAGAASEGVSFRRRTADGAWSKRLLVAHGQLIYPGLQIRNGILHLMFGGWDPPAALYEAVFYMRSADGGKTWTRADGAPIKTPFEYDPNNSEVIAQMDRVTRTLADDGVAEPDTHNQQIFIDRHDAPHILYGVVGAFFPTPERTPRLVQIHARHDGKHWRHSQFTAPDADVHGPAITEDASGRLHAIVGLRLPGHRHGELAHCFSDDHGDHWSEIVPFTSGADAAGRGYSYTHWAPRPWRGSLWFVCNRPGGGSILLGEIKLDSGGRA
jgi:hypothetical protein